MLEDLCSVCKVKLGSDVSYVGWMQDMHIVKLGDS